MAALPPWTPRGRLVSRRASAILRSNSVQEIDGKEVGKARAFLQQLEARRHGSKPAPEHVLKTELIAFPTQKLYFRSFSRMAGVY